MNHIELRVQKIKILYLWSIDFSTRVQYNSMGKGSSFQQMVPGPKDIYVQENKVRTLPHTIYKNNSNWITELNVRTKTIKLLEKKHSSKSS